MQPRDVAVPLAGRAVRLDPTSLADAPGVLVAADHDEVFRWSSAARPRDAQEARQHVERLLAAPGIESWTVRSVRDGTVLGLTCAYDIDPASRALAIGYTWLSRGVWGRGVNTEAKRLQLGHAFETLACVRVVWHVDALNTRSRRAVEALGASLEGVLRKHKQRRDGSWRDTALYAMTDEEWPGARARLDARLPPVG